MACLWAKDLNFSPFHQGIEQMFEVACFLEIIKCDFFVMFFLRIYLRVHLTLPQNLKSKAYEQ